MPAVITIDQRGSRRTEMRATDWAHDLNSRFGSRLNLPFTQTIGDEIQAMTEDAGTAVEILLDGVRDGAWWLGLGLGRIEHPLRDSAAHSRGPAFYEARQAVEAAKRTHYGFAVAATDPEAAREIRTVLELLAFVIKKRGTDKSRWHAIELARAGESTVRIGAVLGISQQAASKRLLNAGFEEEEAGRRLVEGMIRSAMREDT
jgi:hypothetical protein